MSWFKGAIDKVKEKSAAVKDIAKDVAFKTKEVRSRFLGASTAEELKTQLEIRAGSVESCEYLHETLRFWVSQMQLDSHMKGCRYPDNENDRSLTFTQVLLRSDCIQELLACIVCSQQLRGELLPAWTLLTSESPDASPSSDRTHANSSLSIPSLAASSLREFLSRTLVGDESVWFPLIAIFLSPHGHDESEVPSDTIEEDMKIREFTTSSADWMARCQRSGFRYVELSLVRALKKGWFSDWLETERRELAFAVDSKRTEAGDTMWEKVRLSGELVTLYEQIQSNLDVCSMHHVEENKAVLESLAEQTERIVSLKSAAESDKAKSIERQAGIASNASTTESEFKPRIESVMSERELIDRKISELETQRHQLKLELERISASLVAAQAKQRLNMVSEESLREELGTNRVQFDKMLQEEKHQEHEFQVDFELNSKCIECIENSRKLLVTIQEGNNVYLNEICGTFENAFLEAVQDHVSVLCESIQEIYRRCKRLVDDFDSVRKSSMSQVLKSANENEEFNASIERTNLRLNQIESKLQLEEDNTATFRTQFNEFFAQFETKLDANRLLKGQVDKIRVVLAETEKILSKRHQAKVGEVILAASTIVIEE